MEVILFNHTRFKVGPKLSCHGVEFANSFLRKPFLKSEGSNKANFPHFLILHCQQVYQAKNILLPLIALCTVL